MQTSNLRPVRILREFPFVKSVLSGMPKDLIGRDGIISYEHFNAYFGQITAGYNRLLDRLPRDERPNTTEVMMSLGEAGIRIAEFNLHGRNTFVLSRDISAALAKTSLEGVRITDLRMPFRAFYMAFEQAPEFSFSGQLQCIEGVYVRQITTGFALSISVLPRHHRFGSLIDVLPNIVIDLDQDEDMTLAEALDAAMVKSRAKFATAKPLAFPEDVSEQAADAGIRLQAADPPAEKVVAERNIAAEEAIREALAIVANSLCLLSAQPDDLLVEDGWDGASSAEERLLETSSKKARQRAKAELLERGALPVRRISLKLGKSADRSDYGDASETGGTVRAHWRRGHWRRQPTGAGRQEIRLLWIRPVLVNPASGVAADLSIYTIKTPSS